MFVLMNDVVGCIQAQTGCDCMGMKIQGFLNVTQCRLVNWHYLAVDTVLQARKSGTAASLWDLNSRHTELIRGAHLAQQDMNGRIISKCMLKGKFLILQTEFIRLRRAFFFFFNKSELAGYM